MKRNHKNRMIILLIILCFSCRKNVNEENKQEISIVNKEDKKETMTSYPIEEKNTWSVICYTNITDSNVNVRISPSLEAKVVYKLQNDDIVEVRGFSNETMTIDGYHGNWVNIYYTDRRNIFTDRSIPGVYFLNRDTYELKHVIYSGAFSSGRKIFIDKSRLYTNNLYRGVVRKVTDFADRHYIKQVSGIF